MKISSLVLPRLKASPLQKTVEANRQKNPLQKIKSLSK